MQRDAEPVRESRPRGLVVLAVLVVAGVGVTAGYLQWKAPDIRAGMVATARAVQATPDSTAGRLAAWVAYGNPLVHHRLQEMRLSPERPWLVTHAVGRATPGEPVDIYGIDLTHMPQDLARVDGDSVRVTLPTPRFLGRSALTDAAHAFVPIYAEDVPGADDAPRLKQLAEFALGGLGRALERDILGAHFVIEVESSYSWNR